MSGIPTPGRSGIPTPGQTRPRSSIGLNDSAVQPTGPDEMRAFSEAMKRIDPSQYDSDPFSTIKPNPQSTARKSFPSRPSTISTRPSSRASSVADHPPPSILRAKTPTNPTFAHRPYAPRSSTASNASSYASRPESRQSDTRSTSRLGSSTATSTSAFVSPDGKWKIGDAVRINNLGFEGTLRYIGEIAGKAGVFAGVELGPGFRGKGKNDGSVDG